MNLNIRLYLKLFGRFCAAGSRDLPNFLIIGAQKAGTSSLFEYLVQHPEVRGSMIKEVQFFTRRHWIGKRGYRAFFPRREPGVLAVGEATPYYLFSPEAAKRAAKLIPGARLLVLLREPVERAYSHYKHNLRRGHETRPFEDVVARDIKIHKKAGNLLRQPDEGENEFRHHSYVRRGIYHEQVARWMEYFSKEQIHIARAEDFFAEPSKVTTEFASFLGLSNIPIATDRAHNQYAYDRKTRDDFPDLVSYYEEPNRRLFELTGISW